MAGVFVFSYSMETLDRQAEQLGAQEQAVYSPPFPEYTIVGFENQWGSLTIGILGTLLLFAVSFGVAKILRKKRYT